MICRKYLFSISIYIMKNLLKQLDKMLKNKVVLYGILFLTITNVFGYLMTKNYEAVVFFALVYYLTGEFTRNNILIALVALVSTNALLAMVQGRKIYESMVGQEGAGHEKKKDGDAKKEGEDSEKKEGDAKKGDVDAKDKKNGESGSKKDGFAVKKKETLSANMEASVPKLDLGDGSNFQEHMANLNKLESLLNKQEGLVGSLDKIDGMMSRLENLGGMMGKKKTE